MTAKKRPARRPIPPMPLSELPMMKALLALIPGGVVPGPLATKGDPKTQFMELRLAIIDKLQVLALRRPEALIIVAQVLEALLNEQLKFLDEPVNSPPRTKTRNAAGRHRHDPVASR
jgi:hypothetical protein